ncbi:unnamed protein product [Adineta steineri]|uniref:Uncharacterized protein n=1 Tax=Adineta steineri TaxID=433720 RepID=A0A816EIB6_9BILA|nr:unnamed protein product [Adineta steineri]CAF1646859.1 unnamed protein product [Adineta steineri]
MDKFRNVQNGNSNINPVVLSTSGIATCMSTVIELENTVFICHIESSDFIASDTCSIIDAHAFFNGNIQERLNDNQCIKLKNEIDRIREDSSITANGNRTAPFDHFYLFINSIKMNLIEFNIKPKTPHGTNKRPWDNDNPNDYIMDCTVIYDRSRSPHIFAVYQFGGQEHQVECIRRHSLLLGIYVFA